MCQVGEMCGWGNRDGVKGSLGHRWLWTSWRTLGSHEHHWGVGGCRVVGWHNTRLHMGLGARERAQVWVSAPEWEQKCDSERPTEGQKPDWVKRWIRWVSVTQRFTAPPVCYRQEQQLWPETAWFWMFFFLSSSAACLHKGGAQRQTHIQHVTSAKTVTRGYSLLFKFDLETATFVFHVQRKLPVKWNGASTLTPAEQTENKRALSLWLTLHT